MDMVANGAGVLIGWALVATPLGKLLGVVEKWQRSR